MSVATGDGVNIVNPTTVFQSWLTGNADYGLCTYKLESQRVLVLKSAIDDIMKFASNRITLVEGKREDQQLFESMSEAISQAIALSEVTNTNSVGFYLSDGRNWVFSLLTKDGQGNRVCYEGEIFTIIEPRQDILEAFQGDIHKVVEFLYHWVSAFTSEEILRTIVSCLAGCKRRSNVRSALYFVGYGKIKIYHHCVFNAKRVTESIMYDMAALDLNKISTRFNTMSIPIVQYVRALTPENSERITGSFEDISTQADDSGISVIQG